MPLIVCIMAWTRSSAIVPNANGSKFLFPGIGRLNSIRESHIRLHVSTIREESKW